MNQEREELIHRFEKEKSQLNNEISAIASDRDALLINSENEKQQVILKFFKIWKFKVKFKFFLFEKILSLGQQEKNALFEKLNGLKDENGKINNDLVRSRRDAQLKQEQDKTQIISLQDDLKRIRHQ